LLHNLQLPLSCQAANHDVCFDAINYTSITNPNAPPTTTTAAATTPTQDV